jgi:hypothetical protein
MIFFSIWVYMCVQFWSLLFFLKTAGLVRIFHLIRTLRFSAVRFAKWINPPAMVYQWTLDLSFLQHLSHGKAHFFAQIVGRKKMPWKERGLAHLPLQHNNYIILWFHSKYLYNFIWQCEHAWFCVFGGDCHRCARNEVKIGLVSVLEVVTNLIMACAQLLDWLIEQTWCLVDRWFVLS